jgi:membrane-bound metal-dependent hydrolase YbcI (DUF457 family)
VPKRHVPGTTAALVLGSLFPDIDAVVVTRGFDVYLATHASGTHSIVGTLVGAFIVAFTLRALPLRAWGATGDKSRGSRLLPLFAASWVGTVGHVVGDLANGSDTRVLEPFSSAVFGWHLVAMGEPIVIAILAAGLLAAWWRSAHRRQIAVATLILLMSVLVLKRATQSQARAVFARQTGRSSDAVAMTPRMGALFAWTLVERRDDRVTAWTVDTWTGTMTPDFELRDPAASAAVNRSRDLPVVRTLLRLARMPIARTENANGTQLVLWSDAANCSARGCDVSFGGAFDAAGAPLYQLIRVGGFTEQRPAPQP